jgi:uncharacterized repeat protein (TIGR01451 family)
MKSFRKAFGKTLAVIGVISLSLSTWASAPSVPVVASSGPTAPAVTTGVKAGNGPASKPVTVRSYKPGVRSADQLYADAQQARLSQAQPVAEDSAEYLLDAAGNARIIVELQDPPLTNYVAALSNPARTPYLAPTGVGNRLNAASAPSLAYRAQLQQKQAAVISALGARVKGLKVTYQYDVAFNGFATAVPRDQLNVLRALSGVKAVYPDTIKTVRMDKSLPLIGAPTVWATISATLGITEPGKGVRVAIVDSGIDPYHPFFSNTGVFTYPAGFPKGYCTTTPGFCNGKIIAARYYTQSGAVNISETLSPLDADGHGTHVAGTAAGNLNVQANIGTYTATVSGVAPFAYLMAYKGLWLNVAGDNGSGENSGLIAAINDAVADGADVINNSWGSTGYRTGNPDADPANIAAGNGALAGVITVWAGGNDGPNDRTITDEGATSRLIEVAATTSRTALTGTVDVSSTAVTVTIPASATHLVGAASIGSPGSVRAPYVDVGNIVGPLPAGSLTGKVCLVTRGTIARVDKTRYCQDAGAIAAVLRNNWLSASAPDDIASDPHRIPTLHLNKANSKALTDGLNSLGALSQTVRVGLSPAFDTGTGVDVVADFSNRGPSSNIDLIKPDLSAPGVEILSSVRYALKPGQKWDFLGGTSMASPHVAGSAALLLGARPDWYSLNSFDRVLRVKSALMNTSVTSITVSSGAAARLEDMGAGRIFLPPAADPGVVFDPPSYSFGQVAAAGEHVFTVTNVTSPSAPLTFTFSTVKYITNAAYLLSATPMTLVVPAGGTAVYTLSLSTLGLPTGDYEGQVYWTQVGGPRVLHVPYWFRRVGAAFDAAVHIITPRDQGSKPFHGVVGDPFTTTISTLYGLAAPQITSASATSETDQSATAFPLNTSKGWSLITYTIPANTGRLVVSTGNANVSDVDLYLLYDFGGDGYDFADGNPANPASDVFAVSAGGTANERVDVLGGPGSLLEYLAGKPILIGVYNFISLPATFKVRTWAATPTDGGLSLSNFPSTLTGGQVVSPVVKFNKPMIPGESYYGLVNLGDPTNETAIAQVLVNVDRIASEVQKTGPGFASTGQVITYSVVLQNQDPVPHNYVVTDVLPAGVSYVPGSLSGPNANYDAGQNAVVITASFPAQVKAANYTFEDDSMALGLANQSPLGGFYDAAGSFGQASRPDGYAAGIDTGCGLQFYGSTNDTPTYFGYSSRGVFFPRSSPTSTVMSGDPVTVSIPNPALPNGFINAYGAALSISATAQVTDAGRVPLIIFSAGPSAVCPTDYLAFFQLKSLYLRSDPTQRMDVNIVYDYANPDHYWVLYGNVTREFAPNTSTGTENFAGDLGLRYTGSITNGRVIHYYRPLVPPSPITVTFQVTVNAIGPSIITNTLGYSVDVPDTGLMMVTNALRVAGPTAGVLVTATPSTLPADGTSTAQVVATVVDALGTALPGVSVSLMTSAGVLSPTGGLSDANGQVAATLRAPTSPGTATVFATADGKTGSAKVMFTQGSSTYDLLSASTLTQSANVVRKGDTITYTFTVTNAGTGDVNNVLMAAPIPSGTQYVNGSAVGGVPFGGSLAALLARNFASPRAPEAVTTIVWNGSIAAGGSHIISYAVKVTPLEGVITNTARVYVDVTEAGSFTVTATVQARTLYFPIVIR